MRNIKQLGENTVLYYLLLAYLFSIMARLYGASLMPQFSYSFWNDAPILTTEDGFYFASLVQHYLEQTLQTNPRLSPWFEHALTALTVILVKLTPWNADTIQYYLPVYAASALVIPVFLTARFYMAPLPSFGAALLASVSVSYYNRTVVGYYDTDMFAVTWPMMIVYLLIASNHASERFMSFILAAALSLVLYPFVYNAGTLPALALGVCFILYRLVFSPKDPASYQAAIMIFLALMPLPIPFKLLLLPIIYWLIHRYEKSLGLRSLVIVSTLLGLLLIIAGDIPGAIWQKVTKYTLRGLEQNDLHFLKVKARETLLGNPVVNAERISGSIYTFVAAMIGYITLILKNRTFLLTLPLLLLGIFSLWGGVRFTIYAAPVAAIGLMYLASLTVERVRTDLLRSAALITVTALALFPNMTHISTYKITPVLSAYEILTLDTLKRNASPEDYVISWWDYGYPIWYYADKNTLIDGGKHNHDNFIVSEILSTPSQLEAARLSRIAQSTYVDNNYSVVADQLFYDAQNHPINVRSFLDGLKTQIVSLPEKQHEIYLYLPLQMLNSFSNVLRYSRIDLNEGTQEPAAFFFRFNKMDDEGDYVVFANGIRLHKPSGLLEISNNYQVPVKYVFSTDYDAEGILHVEKQLINEAGTLNIIRMIDEHAVVVLDDVALNSTYVQLMIFEHYDPELFELIEKNIFAKIYRIKI